MLHEVMVHTPDQNISSSVIQTVIKSSIIIHTEHTFILHVTVFVDSHQNVIYNATDLSLLLSFICQTSETQSYTCSYTISFIAMLKLAVFVRREKSPYLLLTLVYYVLLRKIFIGCRLRIVL